MGELLDAVREVWAMRVIRWAIFALPRGPLRKQLLVAFYNASLDQLERLGRDSKERSDG